MYVTDVERLGSDLVASHKESLISHSRERRAMILTSPPRGKIDSEPIQVHAGMEVGLLKRHMNSSSGGAANKHVSDVATKCEQSTDALNGPPRLVKKSTLDIISYHF